MGERGAVPGSKTRLRMMSVPQSDAADVAAPDDLDGEALDFWHTHAQALADANCLSPMDVASFKMLCLTWERLQNATDHKQYVELIKLYRQQAKEFGLTPAARKALAVSF